MKRSLPLFVALILIALVVWFAATRRPATPRAPAFETSASASDTETSGSQLEGAIEDAPRKEAAVASGADAGVSLASDTRRHQTVVEQASLRGRFLHASGAPAAGVRLTLSSTISLVARSHEVDMAPDFSRSMGESDAAGRFDVRFEPSRGAVVELYGDIAGFARESWRWPSLAPGQVIDLGETELQVEATVSGRVVDTNGVGLAGWVVTPGMQFDGSGRARILPESEPTGATGEFRLTGLPTGRVSLRAQSLVYGQSYGPSVRARAGEEVHADIVCQLPVKNDRIIVNLLFDRTNVYLSFDHIEIVLLGQDQPERRAFRVQGRNPSSYFSGVTPGEYTVQLRDPRFRPVTIEHVQLGATVDMPLAGNVSIDLNVVDDASGVRIERHALDVRNESIHAYGNVVAWFGANAARPAGTPIEGLLPIDQTLVVKAEGYADLEIPLRGLQAGETRPVEARLVRGAPLLGRVIGERTKSPIPEARVRLARLHRRPGRELSPGARFEADIVATTTSDSEGRFTFASLGAGEHEIEARLGSVVSRRTSFTPSGAAPEPRLEIELPSAARLVGRILVPPGTRFDGVEVFVSHVPDSGKQKPSPKAGELVAIDAQGVFVSPWVEAGVASVTLFKSRARIPAGELGWSEGQGPPVDLGTVLLSPDTDTQHDFDLRDSFPAGVDVFVVVDGKIAVGAFVKVFDPSLGFGGWSVETDAHGRAHFPLIPPATYAVGIYDPDGLWTWSDPRPLKVDVALGARREATIELFDGEMIVRTGVPPQPLSNSRVAIVLLDHSFALPVGANTDAMGRAHARLPIGHWSVSEWPPGLARALANQAQVEWTSAGPKPRTVDLVDSKR